MTELLALTVVSFNIRYGTANDGPDSWPNRREAVLSYLREKRPAILGLQEALAFQNDEIVAAVPGYRSVGTGRDDNARAGEFSSILFDSGRFDLVRQGQFWFSDTPDVVASTSWGNRITRICTNVLLRDRASAQLLWVFNVHLDHESQPSREKSVELLLKRIAERSPKAPVIVTGDFNAGEANPAIGRMTSGGFRDTFRVYRPEAQAVGTFHAFQGGTQGDKIDFIFASPEWKVEDARIELGRRDGHWLSDHYPVSATLRLAK